MNSEPVCKKMSKEYRSILIGEAYRNILGFLNETTDDSFFFFDFKVSTFYFSDRIREKVPLFTDDRTCCTIEEWKSVIYPQDASRFLAGMRKLQGGRTRTYDMEYRIFNRTGDIVWISSRGKSMLDERGEPLWMIGSISEKALANKADQFTGTFNMVSLKNELEKLLKEGQNGYLLVAGIDELKTINIKKGWEYGNALLKLVARYLEDATDGNRVYRVNGDCFATIIEEEESQVVETVFFRLQQYLNGQCTLSGGAVPLQKCTVPDAGTLFQYAENSLDCAKAQGKNRLNFFSAEDYKKDLAALELKEDLYQSVRMGFQGFSLAYQPQVYANTLELYGAEALLRFYSPRCGNVSPAEFIPILEETGLITCVGMWVLETALKQCKKWQKHIPQFHISINMSCCQLEKKGIATDVISCVNRSGISPSSLTLEITESMSLLSEPSVDDAFSAWKQARIRVSVDDFGTGYSNLGRLEELDINEIKIDRCFVKEVQNSVYNHRLISNMIELANSQDMTVCCEGIETVDELISLKELKPTLLQGYLFSKPCTAE